MSNETLIKKIKAGSFIIKIGSNKASFNLNSKTRDQVFNVPNSTASFLIKEYPAYFQSLGEKVITIKSNKKVKKSKIKENSVKNTEEDINIDDIDTEEDINIDDIDTEEDITS